MIDRDLPVSQKKRICFNNHRKLGPDSSSWPIHSHGVLEFHKSLEEYTPTPCLELKSLAKFLGVRNIFVKDESRRFGLKAFKALGASYGIHRWLQRNPNRKKKDVVFCTATDGNHGRAVAWTARRLGQRAYIFVPSNTVSTRIKEIRNEGAHVEVVDGNYDLAVQTAAAKAKEFGWQVISDTSYGDYKTVPADIMSGYTSIFRELENSFIGSDELHPVTSPKIDFVFLQAGVGAFAAAASWYYVDRYGGRRPKLISVEPTDADCLLESALGPKASLQQSHGKQDSIMAGLNCGTPSSLAWPILRESIDAFLSIDDDYARLAMHTLARPLGGDPSIVSGESGAAGLGGLICLLRESSMEEIKVKLGLNEASRILVINTEGDTDPDHYQKVISNFEDRGE